jgi:hypothetical protein
MEDSECSVDTTYLVAFVATSSAPACNVTTLALLLTKSYATKCSSECGCTVLISRTIKKKALI